MTKSELKSAIDALGSIKAKIADLEVQEKALRAKLVDLGDGSYEGDTFRATVSTATRYQLDMDAVRDKLSPQFIAAHTTTSQVISVKVSARNGQKIAA